MSLHVRFTPSPNGARVHGTRRLFEAVPPIDYLISSFVPRGTVQLVTAPTNTGKTWFLLEAARAVATGGKWLGAYQCQKGRVLFLDWENGLNPLRRRIQGLAMGAGHEVIKGFSVCTEPGDLDTDEFEAWLGRMALHYALIIIDPFRAAAARIDENDSRVRHAIDRARRVTRKTRCSILIAHHAGKASSGNAPKNPSRGSTAIMDAVDGAFYLSKRNDSEKIKVENMKCRFAEKGKPIYFKLDATSRGYRVVQVEAAEGDDLDADGGERLMISILDFLEEHPGRSAMEIRKGIKVRAERVRGALKILEADRSIENRGDKRKAAYFVRAEH